MHLHEETIQGLHARLAGREVSSEEVTRSLLDRISELNRELNAYVTVTEEQALAQAMERACCLFFHCFLDFSPWLLLPGHFFHG